MVFLISIGVVLVYFDGLNGWLDYGRRCWCHWFLSCTLFVDWIALKHEVGTQLHICDLLLANDWMIHLCQLCVVFEVSRVSVVKEELIVYLSEQSFNHIVDHVLREHLGQCGRVIVIA